MGLFYIMSYVLQRHIKARKLPTITPVLELSYILVINCILLKICFPSSSLSTGTKSCHRTDEIYKLNLSGNDTTDLTGEWALTGFKLQERKSSHDLSLAPLTFCQRPGMGP